ncbi:ribonuclease P protein component [Candidatus Gottesmanbacteria bacterium]|nr:ribonuclease P protein component [Candidatus Gottesmanbacteria bacterium]
MLPFANRLPSETIRELLRSGKRISCDWYQLTYKKTTGMPRFGFIVSTKINKRAVVRNRIRRLLRESAQHLLPVLSACDCVVVVQKNITEKTEIVVEQGMRDVFQGAGLLK